MTRNRNHVELLPKGEYKKFYGKIKTTAEYNKYYKIVMETIKQYVIEGNILNLQFNLGQLCIVKKERHTLKTVDGIIKRRYIDWNKTYKLRKEKYPTYTPVDWSKPENKDKCIVIFDNSHTDDYMYVIKLRKNFIKYNPAIIYWVFKPVQKFSRQVAQYLKNNKKLPNYYEHYKTIKYKFDNREFNEKIAAHNLSRKRDGYRKYLRSLKENRD